MDDKNTSNNNQPDKANSLDGLNVPAYKGNKPASETASFPAQPVTQATGDTEAKTSSFPVAAGSPSQPLAGASPRPFAGVSSGSSVGPASNPFTDSAPANPAYGAAPTTISPEAAATDELTEDDLEKARLRGALEERREDPRRGTIDFGLLLVRVALSVYLIVSGISTFFKLGGSEGISGLEADFAAYDFSHLLAIAIPTLQLIAGAFLLLGLVTPVFAMIALVVTGFTAIHEVASARSGLDIFGWPEAVWLSVVLFIVAIAVQFTGPGVISLDFSRSWARRPLATSWIFVILGIAALVAAWWFGAGVNPLS